MPFDLSPIVVPILVAIFVDKDAPQLDSAQLRSE